MNKKSRGFTLVELLGVIILLSLIMLLVFPKIVNSIKNSSKDTDKLSEELIYNAAKLYIDKYKNNYPKNDGNVYCIAVKDLVDEKYLTGPVTFSDGEDISDIKTVEVSYTDGFSYSLKDNAQCTEVIKYVLQIDVPLGLTPVVYKDNAWKVADISTKWYNYDNQKWANAVILNSGVTKNVGDIIDVSSEIKGMFVYIPRYEYKIEGQYGTHSDGTIGTQEQPGEIEVNFISKDTTTASSGYRIHPAFTFGTEQLSGIWVGKFETTGDATTPTVLPSSASLVNEFVSAQFKIAKKFNTYINNSSIDAHMAKNSEWGAIAYLSQSKYGKYGNSSYRGTNKEIMRNNCYNSSKKFITGIGSNSYTEAYNVTTCTTNTYETEKGQAASTTGNITGVYDMSGGAWDNTMGVYNKTTGNSNFTSSTWPDVKYYDNYTSDSQTTACNGEICYGHALSETSGWYDDSFSFVKSSTPWIMRGGSSVSTTSAGVFSSGIYTGTYYIDQSFRIVFIET